MKALKRAVLRLPQQDTHHKKEEKMTYYDPFVQLDLDVAQATKDVQICREVIFAHSSVSSSVKNSVHEFSKSRKAISTFMLQLKITSENDKINNVLLKLGNAQSELHKLAEKYHAQLSQEMSIPSECLLNQLQTVEEVRRQCEEKRLFYQQMKMKKEKRNGRSVKEQVKLFQNFQTARDAYYNWGSFYVGRCKSLMQSVCQTLIAQTAQNFSAEIDLFQKALASYEAIVDEVQNSFEKYYDGSKLKGSNQNDHSNDGSVSLECRSNMCFEDSSSLQDSLEKSEGANQISTPIELGADNVESENELV
ncbi:uncharacterized protein At2g33490-like [Nymphaea colorata]|nr:uncharacterized protein At2g33490-like [Nymphaea colorata]